MKSVVVVIDDLFFRAKVAETAKAFGVEVRAVRSPEELDAGELPGIVFVDLEADRLKPIDIIRAVKRDPRLRAVPVIGYYPHARVDLKEAALAAGLDRAMARSEFSRRLPEFFQDPIAAEVRAVREGIGVIELPERGRLEVAGGDRVRFMHGMTTSDVKGLTPGGLQESAMVTRQGKMIGVFRILVFEEVLLLEMESTLTESVRGALNRMVVSDDVTIAASDTRQVAFALQGPRSIDLVKRLFDADPGVRRFHLRPFLGREVRVMRDDTFDETGFELTTTPDVAFDLLSSLTESGARPVSDAAAEILRIERGRPRWGVDIDADLLPMEAGLEERVISYTKGCYVGQEVIQRVKTYGQPPRRMRGFLIEGTVLPLRGDPIMAGTETIGTITSAVRSPGLGRPVALGIIRKEHVDPGTAVEIRGSHDAIAARVVELPFPRPEKS